MELDDIIELLKERALDAKEIMECGGRGKTEFKGAFEAYQICLGLLEEYREEEEYFSCL